MTDHSASRRLDVLQEQAPHLIAEPDAREQLDAYQAARAADRATFETMTREQLVAALEGAMAACRMADRQMTDHVRDIAKLQADVAARDRALGQWAKAFAPNRPLGVQFP